MINKKARRKLLGLLITIIILVSCNQGPRSGVELEIISIEPEPIVGQVATVTFEITTNYSSPATISTRFFDTAIGINNYPEMKNFWDGSLTANESRKFFLTVCVLNPGIWQLNIDVVTPEKLGDGEQRFIESDFDHAEVARYFEGPSEIIITVDPTLIVPPRDTPTLIPNDNQDENGMIRPTVEPVINLSQECLEADSQP